MTSAARPSFALTSRSLTIGGLVLAPAGIVVLIASGVDFPPVPPGIVIPLVAAAAVTGLRRWWAPALGAAVAGFLLVGLLVAGQAVGYLSDPGDIGASAGAAMLFSGLVMAMVAGVVATIRSRPRRDAGAG